MIRHKVHVVSVRKSQGLNLGPFKGLEAPYNGRKTLVEFCLYNTQIKLTYDSYFKKCVRDTLYITLYFKL